MITTEQKKWTNDSGWQVVAQNNLAGDPQLVLVFGASSLVSQQKHFDDLKKMFPQAHIVIGSSAGEILDTKVSDNEMVLTAIHFDSTEIKVASSNIADAKESRSTGEEVARQLPPEKLVHVLLISDGLKVNGTELVKGVSSIIPSITSVTGGLAGDGADFKHTCVGADQVAQEGKVVAIGFYGDKLRIGYGSLGGWDTFGPTRKITKADGNVLLELDGQPALELYKKYLGDKAKDLPSSGLLFPLELKMPSSLHGSIEVVRTLLSVDESQDSMTFAGDMPVGVEAKFMKANLDRLIEGASGAASGAASMSLKGGVSEEPELAILISCIGRKLVLKERTEEELEAVRSVLGNKAALVGFYSYGEICPTGPTEKQCQLHNQTMTITVFKES